jgi:hypothetical protein
VNAGDLMAASASSCVSVRACGGTGVAGCSIHHRFGWCATRIQVQVPLGTLNPCGRNHATWAGRRGPRLPDRGPPLGPRSSARGAFSESGARLLMRYGRPVPRRCHLTASGTRGQPQTPARPHGHLSRTAKSRRNPLTHRGIRCLLDALIGAVGQGRDGEGGAATFACRRSTRRCAQPSGSPRWPGLRSCSGLPTRLRSPSSDCFRQAC